MAKSLKKKNKKEASPTSSEDVCVKRLARTCEDVCPLLRSLAHPERMLIMGHLVQGEKTVSELQKACTLSQSQLSQFLGRMKLEKLVKCRREGRFQYYSPADDRIAYLIRAIQAIYCR